MDNPQVYFGQAKKTIVDWRNVISNEQDDDAEMLQTPEHIVTMLGFDPLTEYARSKP